jgi:membrane protein CcdC involved in cytochrome C biogenesis
MSFSGYRLLSFLELSLLRTFLIWSTKSSYRQTTLLLTYTSAFASILDLLALIWVAKNKEIQQKEDHAVYSDLSERDFPFVIYSLQRRLHICHNISVPASFPRYVIAADVEVSQR